MEITLQHALSALAIAASASVALFVARQNRTKRRLGFELLSASKLISGPGLTERDLALTFKGQPVKDPHLVRFRFVNCGNASIAEEDFKGKRLRFALPGSTILSFDVAATKPISLRDQITTSLEAEERAKHLVAIESGGGFLEVGPILLNPKNEVTVAVVTADAVKDLTADLHVPGIDEPHRLARGPASPLRVLGLLVTGLLLLLPIAGVVLFVWMIVDSFVSDWRASLTKAFAFAAFIGGTAAFFWLVDRLGNRDNWPDSWR